MNYMLQYILVISTYIFEFISNFMNDVIVIIVEYHASYIFICMMYTYNMFRKVTINVKIFLWVTVDINHVSLNNLPYTRSRLKIYESLKACWLDTKFSRLRDINVNANAELG